MISGTDGWTKLTEFDAERKRQGIHRKLPWIRVGAGLLSLFLFMTFLGVMSRKDATVKEAHDEIIGTWESADPRYKGCTMEFTPYRFVLGNPLTGLARNYLLEIRKSQEENRTLYEITYENEEGRDYLICIYYIRAGGAEIIQFKNEEVKWARAFIPGL